MYDLLQLLARYPGCTLSFRHDENWLGGWQAKVEKTIHNEENPKKPHNFKKVIPFNAEKLKAMSHKEADAHIEMHVRRALEEVYAARPYGESDVPG